ncbi:MAG TPA: hypothetical protein VMT46_04420 [Anaerolineaceae bacterium]|nr:hypothetical protein [Anaerolineaceae bacterium]
MVNRFDAGTYEIHVLGNVPSSWEDAFRGMDISKQQVNGDVVTILRGEVDDQASLQGMLQNLYSLGLDLLFLERQ